MCYKIIRENGKSQMHTRYCIYNTDRTRGGSKRSWADPSARGPTTVLKFEWFLVHFEGHFQRPEKFTMDLCDLYLG